MRAVEGGGVVIVGYCVRLWPKHSVRLLLLLLVVGADGYCVPVVIAVPRRLSWVLFDSASLVLLLLAVHVCGLRPPSQFAVAVAVGPLV